MHLHGTPIRESNFCSVLLREMKHGLMAQGSFALKHPPYPATKKVKAARSVRKVMAAVFWDDEGWLLVDFLDRGDSVTVERYCSTLESFGRPFIPDGIGRCAMPSSFCTTSLGTTLSTGHVTDFC
jgi:hypothetical protein